MNALLYASSLAGTSLCRYIIQEISSPPGAALKNTSPSEPSGRRYGHVADSLRSKRATVRR